MSAELLLRCALFRDFTPVGLEILSGLGQMRIVLAGQPLFTEGGESTGLFVLVEGRLQLCARDADGQAVVLGAVEPFEALAEASLLCETPPRHLCTALAETDCRVLEIPRDLFRELQHHKPQACTKLLLAIASDLAVRVADARPAMRLSAPNAPARR